jgi:NTE family protein
MKFKTGLVLSGGGARGFAHVGVLQAIDEANIKIDTISGTSAGALAGVLYAAGIKPKEILQILKNSNYFSWRNLDIGKKGVFKMVALRKAISSLLPETFESLSIPFVLNATNLLSGECCYYKSGLLIEPLIGSASIPVVFNPIEFQGNVLVDGGVSNNFPTEPLIDKCETLIGCHVNKLPQTSSLDDWSIPKIIEQCFQISIQNNINKKGKQCSLFIEPDLFQYRMFDVQSADEIYKIGYKTAKKLLKVFGN